MNERKPLRNGRAALMGPVLTIMMTGALVATIPSSPAVASPVRAWTAYVADGGGPVTPIDTATNRAKAPIPVVGGDFVAITPNGATAYVGKNSTEDTVTPINLATGTAETPISLTGGAGGIAITPNGATAYVTSGDTVIPINTATNATGTPIPAGAGPSGIAITPNGATAYVTNGEQDGTVTPINLVTDTAGAPIPVGTYPHGIAITPNGATVYVANYGACGLGGCDDVTPIDTATNTAESPVYIFGCSFPQLIAITPNGATAYVPCSGANSVVAIDTATNTPSGGFRVGNSPLGVAITPNGATGYVSNENSNTVTPVNLTTNTPGTPINVGSLPFGIAISPDQAPVAHLSVAPAEEGQPTSFDASASTVAFGTISSYAWDFGDGSTATSSVPTTTHTYATPGPYTATVTETDSAGTSATQVFTGQTMSNNGGPSAVASQQLTVAPPLAITTTSVPNGSVWSRTNKAKYLASLAATGGNPPYKWSLATGSSPLPPGLKLNHEGVISGRATTVGTYSFTVQVVDKKAETKPHTQNMATTTLSITIS